jgi:hypothetical protein
MAQQMQQYQAQAKMAYPQNPLFGNDKFATSHPRMAGALGNAFLAASMIKPQATIGGNISEVAGAMLGVSAYHRQQALDQATMPQKWMQERMASQLGSQKTLGEISNANSLNQTRQSEEALRQSTIANQASEIANRRPVQPDPEAQKLALAQKAAGVVDPAHMTQAEAVATEAEMVKQTKRSTPAGSLQEQLLYGAHPPADPSKGYSPAELQTLQTLYNQNIAAQAGAKSNAEAPVRNQQQDAQRLIADAQTQSKDWKVPIQEDPKNRGQQMLQDELDKQNPADAAKRVAAQAKARATNQGVDDALGKYQTSGAPERNEDIGTWKSKGSQNYNQKAAKGPTSGGSTPMYKNGVLHNIPKGKEKDAKDNYGYSFTRQ